MINLNLSGKVALNCEQITVYLFIYVYMYVFSIMFMFIVKEALIQIQLKADFLVIDIIFNDLSSDLSNQNLHFSNRKKTCTKER